MTDSWQQPQGATPQPAKKNNTVRNIVLIVIALLVLCMGGCAVMFGSAVNEVDKAINEEIAKDDEPGGPNNPLTITEGKAFEVLGFKYDAGWKVSKDVLGSFEVTGLKVTNERDKSDGAIIEIRFMQGNEVVGVVDCTTEQIPVGEKTRVSCVSSDDYTSDYDAINVRDTF